MERVELTKNTIVFTILFIVLLAVSYYSRYIVLTALIGIGIGVLISPLLNFLRVRVHLPRALSAIIVLIGLVSIFAGVLASLFYLVSDQVSSLEERWPDIQNSVDAWVGSIFRQFPWIEEQTEQFDFGKYLTTSATGLVKGFKTGVLAFSGVIFALVIGLYTAINSRDYYEKTVEAFYPSKRKKARETLYHCALVIRGWFKAQLIDMVIIGALTAIGLWIAGVEYWAVFALLTAVLGIIPYVGVILVVTAASLITLSTDPSKVPWVLLVFAITQQIEADVVLPLVMKGGVQLPVVPLLIFMMFLGFFFGILGVFVAPPLLAVLRTLYIDLYLPYVEKKSKSFGMF